MAVRALAVTAVIALLLADGSPRAALAAPQVAGGRSPCTVYQEGGTDPRWVTIGNSLTVHTTVRFSCPQWARPSHRYHLMVVADLPALSHSGAAGEPMMRSLEALAQRLALEHNDRARAGVVTFNSHADTACPLHESRTSLPECVEGLQIDDGPPTADAGALAKGVLAGVKELVRERDRALAEDDDEPVVDELLILAAPAADEAPPGYCSGVRDEVREATDRGIAVTAVCLTAECPESCFADSVEDARPYYEWDAVADDLVEKAYHTELRIRNFEFFEVLNPAVHLDESSIDAEGRYRDSDHSIRWALEAAALGESQKLSYRALPTEVGRYDVRLDGAIIAYDTWGDRLTHGISRYAIEVVEDTLTLPYFLYMPSAEKLKPPVQIKTLHSRR